LGPDMLKGQDVFLDYLTLKTKVTSINIDLSAWCNIPEDLNVQKRGCENLKSHFTALPGIISANTKLPVPKG
jgi:hypothetical protein